MNNSAQQLIKPSPQQSNGRMVCEMNAHQRKKFAKALLRDLQEATDDEKLKGLIDAAADFAKQEREIDRLESKNEQLRTTVAEQAERIKQLEAALREVKEMLRVVANIGANNVDSAEDAIAKINEVLGGAT